MEKNESGSCGSSTVSSYPTASALDNNGFPPLQADLSLPPQHFNSPPPALEICCITNNDSYLHKTHPYHTNLYEVADPDLPKPHFRCLHAEHALRTYTDYASHGTLPTIHPHHTVHTSMMTGHLSVHVGLSPLPSLSIISPQHQTCLPLESVYIAPRHDQTEYSPPTPAPQTEEGVIPTSFTDRNMIIPLSQLLQHFKYYWGKYRFLLIYVGANVGFVCVVQFAPPSEEPRVVPVWWPFVTDGFSGELRLRIRMILAWLHESYLGVSWVDF